jgi:bile acid-coenzyme A ligase
MTAVPISRAVAHAAARHPDDPAITCGATSITWRELDRRTNQRARAYRELGVQMGSYVTIGLANSIEFFEVALATWKLGAIPQPISHRLPERERRAIVDLARPALVVGPDGLSGLDVAVMSAGWEPSDAWSDAPLPEVVSPAWKAPTSGGSTGRPKLIVSGDAGLVELGRPGSGLRVDGSVCIPGPLYHNAPFSFSSQALFQGNHVALLEHFDAEATLAAVQRHRVDWILLVPTMMLRIWRLDERLRLSFDVSSLETVWHMAAPCPAWLKQAWIDWLGPERIWELYAGTESQAVTIIRGGEWLTHRGSVGRCVIGEMKVLDPETLADMPPGQLGEVFMRSTPGRVSYRYVGAQARVSPDGWESLGDMGWFDAEGYLYLGDRRADMILCGGANIYPAEVEAAIEEHPGVRSCAVIGLADEDLGQRVHAVVETAHEVTANELTAFLAERLVRYKIPRSFEFTDAPVRDDAGKVRRSSWRPAAGDSQR